MLAVAVAARAARGAQESPTAERRRGERRDERFAPRQLFIHSIHYDAARTRVLASQLADVSTSGDPQRVTTTVCSACAVSEPSRVRTVQPSASCSSAPPPALMVGSIVITSPGVSRSCTRGSS